MWSGLKSSYSLLSVGMSSFKDNCHVRVFLLYAAPKMADTHKILKYAVSKLILMVRHEVTSQFGVDVGHKL